MCVCTGETGERGFIILLQLSQCVTCTACMKRSTVTHTTLTAAGERRREGQMGSGAWEGKRGRGERGRGERWEG